MTNMGESEAGDGEMAGERGISVMQRISVNALQASAESQQALSDRIDTAQQIINHQLFSFHDLSFKDVRGKVIVWDVR